MTSWTDEMDTYVIEHRGGESAETIGKFLNVTRNAVIGRSHRLGLPKLTRSPTGRPRKPKAERPRLSKVRRLPVVAKTALDDLLIPAAQRRTIFKLTAETCRWPVGNPDEPGFFYCGAHPVKGLPYCVGHCGASYLNFSCVAVAA